MWLVILSVVILIQGQACPRPLETVPLSGNMPDLMAAFNQVDVMLAAGVARNEIPGLMFTVVYDQDIIWNKGYGKNDPFGSDPNPPTIDSV